MQHHAMVLTPSRTGRSLYTKNLPLKDELSTDARPYTLMKNAAHGLMNLISPPNITLQFPHASAVASAHGHMDRFCKQGLCAVTAFAHLPLNLCWGVIHKDGRVHITGTHLSTLSLRMSWGRAQLKRNDVQGALDVQ